MYAATHSLIAHVGAYDSLMHPRERKRHPLLNLKFVDGERRHQSLMRREPVIANLASMPSRIDMLAKTIHTLSPQVDGINVFLNGYTDVPPFLQREERTTITVARSQDHGDRGDAGKFFFSPDAPGYVLTCDDDILYPPNYASYLVNRIEAHGRKVVVSAHGATVRRPLRSYFKDRTLFSCKALIRRDSPVDVPGTGVCGFHSSVLRIDPKKDFPTGFMADIHLAVIAHRQGVPVFVVAHPKGWIREIAPANKDTLYHRYARSDAPQTAALQELLPRRS